jgi:hypothetical protein
VWHEGLVYKLNCLKFPNYLIKLIQSFLDGRKAFVEVENQFSFEYSIPAGVPQGSLLSPFLFNIYINDIPHPKNCHLAIYADDTAIFCDAPWRNIKEIKMNLNFGLLNISNFFKDWKIQINSSKTEFAIFTRSTIMKNLMTVESPECFGRKLEWKSPIKYLGIDLDRRLSFKDHIQNSIKKANKIIATLYCILKKNSSASFDTKLTLYKSYIRPLLTYGCPIFSNCPKTHFRMVLSAPYYTRTSDLHLETNIPTIREFADKITDKFYDKIRHHPNHLANCLGDYNAQSLPFRVKHPMPRKV